MSIYTKNGDKGNTSLYGGSILSKDSLRVQSYGSIDEVNAHLGLVYSKLDFEEIKEIIRKIQNRLFILGAYLASDEEGVKKLSNKINVEDIKYLETIIDTYTEEYGKLTGFITPGETEVSAQMHIARTVIRRSERLVVNLSKVEFVCPLVLTYLNRLSDTLFILAKVEVEKNIIKKVMVELKNKLENMDTLEMENVIDSCNFQKTLNKSFLDGMYSAVYKKSKEIGVPISFSVADKNGNLIYFVRDENAILPSISISQNKAYTSAVLKMSTYDLSKHAGPSGSLFGIHANDSKIVIFGGGQCLSKDGEVLGAIGVSGGSVEDDILIGNSAIAYFQEHYRNERR